MRTWEKIWWGFILSALGIFLVGILFKGDKIKVDIPKEGVKYYTGNWLNFMVSI